MRINKLLAATRLGEHDIHRLDGDKLKFMEDPHRPARQTGPVARRRRDRRLHPLGATRQTNDWAPDHAVMDANKEQLKAMPQFKWSIYN